MSVLATAGLTIDMRLLQRRQGNRNRRLVGTTEFQIRALIAASLMNVGPVDSGGKLPESAVGRRAREGRGVQGWLATAGG